MINTTNRIGIFGGSFNPIHNGHIMLANEAYNKGFVDEVIFIPNNIPAYKDNDDILDSDKRLKLISVAIKNYEFMSISNIELKRGGVTYTVDTMKELNKKYSSSEFYFIMGADSLFSIENWFDFETILKTTNILVSERDEVSMDELLNRIDYLKENYTTKEILTLPIKKCDISSSEIRKLLKDKKDVSSYIPEDVLTLICEMGCY